jgi:hypothetical protein
MMPLLMYAAFAGGMGWAITKKKWGLTAFFGGMMLWMMLIQLCMAIMLSHGSFSN